MVCASEEVAKKLAPEETADAEIMLREQAGIVSGLAQSVMDAAFAAKRAALTVDLLVQNLSPHSNRGSEGAVTTRLYTNMEGMKGSKKDSLQHRWIFKRRSYGGSKAMHSVPL